MDDWPLRLFLAIRASQRSLRQCNPIRRLKRQRNNLQRIHNALLAAAELSAKQNIDPSLRKRVLDGANATNALFDDVHYGSNDLDLPIGDTAPASSLRATMMAAFSLIFWLESCGDSDATAHAEAADAFISHINTALRTGLPLDSDRHLAQTYDWSGVVEYKVVTDEDDLYCFADAGP